MKKVKKRINVSILFVLICITIFMSSCYSTYFTSGNMIKLHVGMTDKEVISIFGYPQNTQAGTCGQYTRSPWTCIKWYYGKYDPILTMQVSSDGKLFLNSWSSGY